MRVFLITGTSRGIGKAIAQECLKLGYGVLGISRSAKQDLGPNYEYIQMDLTEPMACQRAVNACIERFGRLDCLVHNSGTIQPIQTIATLHVADLKKLFDINLFSAIELIQLCLPMLRESRGSIILVSSGAAIKAYHGWIPYCCSKGALNMLAEGLSLEEPLITTIALRPGVVDTEMQTEIRTNGKGAMNDTMYEKFINLKESNELLDPSLPAKAIVKLGGNPDIHFSGKFLNWSDVE
jgi:NAD(P)-dependent dehydrogenase (short-subunit alcohol dehydrogenase family)